MYSVVVVENMLLHGQNGKKSKKVRVFGIFKSDSGGGGGGAVFWILIKNRTIIQFFLIDAKFCPL